MPAATRPKPGPRRKRSRRRLPPGARQRAATVVDRLRAEYPVASCALEHESPLQLLVATILSAQSTDKLVNLVTPVLFARYPTAAALAAAPQAEVEEIIKSTGFFRMKSLAIREMAHDVVERFDGDVPPRMEDLVTLRGVGRKTANVVLGVAFGVPGFAVDTHVTRLCAKLKLTSATDPVEIERDVTAMVPPQEWTELSLRLIMHGRQVCVAGRPRCPQCVLNDICPSAELGPLRTKPARAKPQAASSARPVRSPSAS